MRKIIQRSNKRYGCIPSLKDSMRPKFSLAFPQALPSSVNLVNSFQPPIFDQLQLGDCVGNGTARAVQYDRAKQAEYAPLLSRLFIYYNARVIEGDPAVDSGCSIANAVQTLQAHGVCPEKFWPYQVWKFAELPPEIAYNKAIPIEVLKAETVLVNPTAIQTVLASGIPVVIGITVFESFESDAVDASGIVPMPAENEGIVGGHCMVICGYDNATQQFLTANSWGADWALDGYCQMPYAYFGVAGYCQEAWAIYSTK